MHKLTDALSKFLRYEALAGIVLLIATVCALLVANSPWKDFYASFWQQELPFTPVLLGAALTARAFVADVLISLFFLFIGCELKREIGCGELSSPEKMRLPVIAALGGMLVPILIYCAVCLIFRWASPDTTSAADLNGWAIPAATDIAFALGILRLTGAPFSPGIKIFLTALAIIDDLGAVLFIGLFYTNALHAAGFIGVCVILFILWRLNKRGVTSPFPYLVLGLPLWFAVHESGLHATLSGILLAAFLPLTAPANRQAPLQKIENALHPYVAFAILPLFAFANAGLSFDGLTAGIAYHPVTLGILLGLGVGKPLGVWGAAWIALKKGIATWPAGARARPMAGVSVLCGIGFTMSLFIGDLAFVTEEHLASVRLGVLLSSALSAVLGLFILRKKGA